MLINIYFSKTLFNLLSKTQLYQDDTSVAEIHIKNKPND